MSKINYRKVTIAQVRKIIRETGKFNGFAVGNKVNSLNFFGNWCLAKRVTFTDYMQVLKFKDNMMFYLPKELGDNIAFYVFED